MKGCTHSPLADDVRGETNARGGVSERFRTCHFVPKSNFKLPQLKMFTGVPFSNWK